MADKSKERILQRCYQCNRFEEELLAMAYGIAWPLIRKALTKQQAANGTEQRPGRFATKRKIGA